MPKEKRYEYRFLRSKKHKAVALLLCVFGGFMGLHYFYVKRPWRGLVNVLLTVVMMLATGAFGMYNTIRIAITFGNSNWLALHWRELVAGVCCAVLGVTWIWDIVQISKGEFRDGDGMRLGIGSSTNQNYGSNKKDHTSKLPLFLLAVVAIVVGVAIGVFIGRNQKSNSQNQTYGKQAEVLLEQDVNKESDETADVDEVIVESDEIDAEFLGFEDHPELGMFTVRLRVKNKTEQPIWVYMDKASINDEMMQMVMTGMPLYIDPGKRGSNGFIFYYKQTSIEKFDDVNTVSFKLKVDNQDTMKEIWTSPEVTLTK